MYASKFLAVAASSAALLLAAGAAQAATLVNGGFERPEGAAEIRIDPPSSNVNVIPGWTVFGNSSVAWLGTGYGAAPHGGSMYVELMGYTDTQGRYGGVTQTVDTSIGAIYRLSFWIGQLGAQSPLPGVLVTAGASSGAREGSSDAWTARSFDFTAAGSTTTISIAGNQGTFHIGLDDVQLQQLTSGAPEPAAWAMMIIGFGMIGAVSRDRRAAHVAA